MEWLEQRYVHAGRIYNKCEDSVLLFCIFNQKTYFGIQALKLERHNGKIVK
jgi:hypothetical protein